MSFPDSSTDLATQIDLGEQLRRDLPELVSRLNRGRSLLERALGKEYELREREGSGEPPFFRICVSYRSGRKRGEGALIESEIKIVGEGLDGSIYAPRRNSQIGDYIHSLSHQHGIPVGGLLRSPSYRGEINF